MEIKIQGPQIPSMVETYANNLIEALKIENKQVSGLVIFEDRIELQIMNSNRYKCFGQYTTYSTNCKNCKRATECYNEETIK